jgi:hypothetical protein
LNSAAFFSPENMILKKKFFGIQILVIIRLTIYGSKGVFHIFRIKYRFLNWIYRKCKRHKTKRRQSREEYIEFLRPPSPKESWTATISPLNPKPQTPMKLSLVIILFLNLFILPSNQLTSITADDEHCLVQGWETDADIRESDADADMIFGFFADTDRIRI